MQTLLAGGRTNAAPVVHRSAGRGGRGTSPQLISSSSDTSRIDPRRLMFGNTGRPRKNSSCHKLMADVTAETREMMVQTLRDRILSMPLQTLQMPSGALLRTLHLLMDLLMLQLLLIMLQSQ